MADIQMNGRGFAPQAGSVHAYQAYQPQGSAPNGSQNGTAASVAQAARTGTALAGAALSLALLIGVSVWGYKLMARDVAGVPVVRAVQGEMRVRPDDPGGRQAQNQGFAVNEVAAAGATAGPSDRIVLAPQPIDLSDNDTPLIDQLASAQPRYAAGQAEPALAPAPQAQPALQADQAELTPEMASIQALADQIAAGATPLTGLGEVSAPPVQTSVAVAAAPEAPLAGGRATPAAPQPLQAPQAAVLDPGAPGIARSVRPAVRPADLRTASLGPAVAPADASGGVRDIDPATIPAGTRLVQLGAYESPEIAMQEWARFSGRFSEYMDGKDRVVQKAQSGGRTFYRLRAMGFADLSDARRFCAALTAQNTDCIPVVTR